MPLVIRFLFLIWCILCLGTPLYAQALLTLPNKPPNFKSQENEGTLKYLRPPELNATELVYLGEKQQMAHEVGITTFKTLYNPPKVNEKESLRAEWKKVFGIDVWYPYYQAKKIEDWVSHRLSIKMFKMKGEPKLGGNQFKYTFSSKF